MATFLSYSWEAPGAGQHTNDNAAYVYVYAYNDDDQAPHTTQTGTI
jgi:hypothetical protein